MFSRGFRALGYRYALAAIPAIGLSNDRFKFNGTINCMQAPAIAAFPVGALPVYWFDSIFDLNKFNHPLFQSFSSTFSVFFNHRFERKKESSSDIRSDISATSSDIPRNFTRMSVKCFYGHSSKLFFGRQVGSISLGASITGPLNFFWTVNFLKEKFFSALVYHGSTVRC